MYLEAKTMVAHSVPVAPTSGARAHSIIDMSCHLSLPQEAQPAREGDMVGVLVHPGAHTAVPERHRADQAARRGIGSQI